MRSSSKNTFRKSIVPLFALLSTSLTLIGCANGKGMPAPTRELGRVGNIQLVAEPIQVESEKIIVAGLLFRDTGIDVIEVRVAIGSVGAQPTMARDFILRLADASGAVLEEYGIMDPRRVVVENQGLVDQEQSIQAARFRFHRTARKVLVLDSGGNVLTDSDLGSVIDKFCQRLNDDPDCKLQ